MELKPGYKQTEVGVIPEDWDVKRLREISPSQSVGLVINPSSYFEANGEVPMLVGSCISENKINSEKASRISSKNSERLAACRLKAGDLVTVRVGFPGTTAVVSTELDGCNCASMMIIRSHKSFDSYWLAQLLNSPIGRAQIENVEYGTAQKQFNMSDAINFVFPVPPPAEQGRIAEAARSFDDYIESLEQKIGKKREIKQATMQELLTGKRRLPGFEGEWEVKRLGELCSMKSGEGITAKSIDTVSTFPCYGGNGQRGFTSRFTHEGDYCLIGRVGALCGNLLKVSGQFFASEHAIVVSAFENVDVAWLTLALGTLNLNRRAESSAQPVLTVSKLLPLEVDVPSTKQEQTAIATVLSDMDAELASLEARLDKARELKQGMMQQLLTGKIRLI